MMKTRRCAGIVALVLMVLVTMVVAGCGGGGDDDGAQVNTGSISGTIVYAATDPPTPLGGVTVTAGNRSTTTADDGSFTLSGVPVGNQVLTITADPQGVVVPPGVDLTVPVTGGQTYQLPAPVQMIDAIDTPPNEPDLTG